MAFGRRNLRAASRVGAVSLCLALPSSCAHFSCAGWDTLPELRTARTDDPRTKKVVLTWRSYYAKQCGGRS